MDTALREARSFLFVPGHRPERFDKALASGADAVILDLEDAVAPDDKAAAREAVARWLAAAPEALRSRIVVRLNDESTPWYEADAALLRQHAWVGAMLPKAERAASVLRLRDGAPALRVIALVETAKGVLNAEALAQASGVERLAFGTIDYAVDLDLSGDPVGLDLAAGRLALASRAADLAPPVAGVTAAIDDDALLREEFARARAHGFGAKLCIHPRQVAAVHAFLQPSAAELAWARQVTEAVAQAGGAVVRVDGKMVDLPVLKRAQRLLQRAT